MAKAKLPGDPSILIIGFVGVVVVVFTAHKPLPLFVVMFLGLSAVTKGRENLELFENERDFYDPNSKRRVNDGRYINAFVVLICFIILVIKLISYLIHKF